MKVLSGLVLVLIAVLAGCGAGEPSGTDASDPGDASDPRAARCADITSQINSWLADHRSCNVDTDCTGEGAYGPLFGTGTGPLGPISCWPPVVLSTDGASGFLALLQQLDDARCDGPAGPCSGYFPSPACRDHICIDT
jgi:hypothetical protein